VGKVALLGEGSTHSPLSTEEIEKKLNVYHKGAKIWKMLIFCQVEPRPPFPVQEGRPGLHMCYVGVYLSAQSCVHVWSST
jgi:hypothetical protein